MVARLQCRLAYRKLIKRVNKLSKDCKVIVLAERKRLAMIATQLKAGYDQYKFLQNEFVRIGAGKKVCRMKYIREASHLANSVAGARKLFNANFPHVKKAYKLNENFAALAEKLSVFDTRCRQLIEENRQTFLKSNLEPSKKKHLKFFRSDLICEGSPYSNALKYYTGPGRIATRSIWQSCVTLILKHH